MTDRGQGGRKTDARSFRPTLDGTLEPRLLLSKGLVSIRAQSRSIHAQVARGGQVSLIRDTDGELYNVNVVGGGTVRAEAMRGGRVRLIVDNTTSASTLSINSVKRPIVRGSAHTYPTITTKKTDRLLHVGEIQIKSGLINQVLGYKTTELSGPLTISGTAPVERVAVFSILPGGAVNTGGDLNTLDVYNNATLSGGPGIEIGRDLNLLNVGGSLDIRDGSRLFTVRDIGLVTQAAKGTGSGGAGAVIQGNMNINPEGRLIIGRALQATFLVQGAINGVQRITGPDLTSPPIGAENFVALGGFFI